MEISQQVGYVLDSFLQDDKLRMTKFRESAVILHLPHTNVCINVIIQFMCVQLIAKLAESEAVGLEAVYE